MGYTHYWYRPAEMNPDKFAAAVADCRKVCEAVPIPLGDWQGEGDPEFSQERVSFNGSVHSESFSRDGAGLCWPAHKAENVAAIGQAAKSGTWWAGDVLKSRAVDEKGDGSYETFSINRNHEPQSWEEADNRNLYFGCCKTNYRPYDLCVQFCLIVFKEHFGEQFHVSSDGEDEDWNEARDGCQVFLGYGLLFALD